MYTLPTQAQQAVDTICKWRPTIIGVDNPHPVPDTLEALRYLTSLRACSDDNPERIKLDNQLKRRKRGKSKSDEGWRDIGEQQIWFDNAWHANYARFLSWFPDIANRWLYKPRKFRLGPFGLYEPTLWVHYQNSGPYWVELDADAGEDIDDKASVFEVYKPKERIFVVDKKGFLKMEGFLKTKILGWEA